MKTMELREVVARCLWRDRFRLRDFDNAKDYLKKVTYAKADEAIKRARLENIQVPVKDEPFVIPVKENMR